MRRFDSDTVLGQSRPRTAGRQLDSGVDEYCVLIVEDDEFVREVLADIVASFGLSVIVAVDGRRAIDVFRRSADEIDCVILDYDIPAVHSSHVVREMKSVRSDVRVLLSSGYPESHVSVNFPISDVDGFIPKPYNSSDLRAELERLQEPNAV